MKNLTLFLLLFFLSFTVFSQKTIRGKVVDSQNVPLLGASVYINNSTIGTTTDDNGEFELRINEGSYTLVVSFIGFETLQYNLKTQTYQKSTFKLRPETNLLDEVVISSKKKKYSKETRAYYLRRFKRQFLGKGDLSKQCVITNEDVISFYFNSKTGTLEAYASKPIQVKNRALGYTIFYDLVHFELTPTKVYYLGFSRFQELKGSKRRNKRWKKERTKAYLGSKTHFFQTLFNSTIKEEGFTVDLLKRVKNPLRPTRREIIEARQYLRLSGKTLTVNRKPYQKTMLITKLDSVKDILSRARLDEFVETVVKTSLTKDEFINKRNNDFYLDYDNVLRVKYLKEKEEDEYRLGSAKLNYQQTKIILLKKPAKLFKEGNLEDPFSVFYDGYFGFEKVAYQLPLDYKLD